MTSTTPSAPLPLTAAPSNPAATSESGSQSSTKTTTNRMRAIRQLRYGGPDVLELVETERPKISRGDQVLLRIEATAVHRGDWHLLHGKPYLIRAVGFGLRRPKQSIPGQFSSGVVEQVGPDVEHLRVGDRVFGEVRGGFAEFAIAQASKLAQIPDRLDFAGAATLANNGCTALLAIRTIGGLEPGAHVLITGASGGVGTTAVQIAKALGARVTATCRTSKHAVVRRLGADTVIDPSSKEHLRHETYDGILDAAAIDDRRALRRTLRSGSSCAMIALGHDHYFGGVPRGMFTAMRTGRSKRRFRMMFAQTNREDLETLANLIERNALTPVVDVSFGRNDAASAFQRLDSGQHVGTPVVIL